MRVCNISNRKNYHGKTKRKREKKGEKANAKDETCFAPRSWTKDVMASKHGVDARGHLQNAAGEHVTGEFLFTMGTRTSRCGEAFFHSLLLFLVSCSI